MQIFRDPDAPYPDSALRALFGRRGSTLVGPLDLCVVESGEVFNPNTPSGAFVGATVEWNGVGTLGTIVSYDWPPNAPGAVVDPLVVITPDAAVDIAGVPDVSQYAPIAHVGDAVQLDGTPISGAISSPLQQFPYPSGAYRVTAYLVDFDAVVLPEMHGTRVLLANGALLGMLLKTDDFPNGSQRALVYPA